MASYVDALARLSIRVLENGSRRTYSWNGVKPNVSADDLNAVADTLMSFSNSTVQGKLLVRNLNIV
ncbi:MAG: hypothetical protein J7M13_02465 [Synergistetes bacterium]|nr:hypothetical protein [Synergistota bacterium]